MAHRENTMIGKVFNKWTIIEEDFSGKKERNYKCQCVCGNFSVIPISTLRHGRSKQGRQCQYKQMFNPEREIGKKYYKWTVLEYVLMKRKLQFYNCQCECGFIKLSCLADIRAGKQTQCRTCHNRQVALGNIKHGKHNSKIYKIWHAIKTRCYKESSKHYKDYGARGIKVCERWMNFENFYADVGDKPIGLELDRINNDGDYCPENCQWVTHQENCLNTRRAKKYKREIDE